jgi:hypothetical protein
MSEVYGDATCTNHHVLWILSDNILHSYTHKKLRRINIDSDRLLCVYYMTLC